MSRKSAPPDRVHSPLSLRQPAVLLQREAGGPLRATLDRLLSKLGLASRSTAQEWIRAGRVSINQQVIRCPDTWVSWPGDQVSVDDYPVREEPKRFLLFHKPKGVITTQHDEKGRKTIFDVLPPQWRVLQAVGRLDQATSGLLLLTNDSALSGFLTDPRHAVPRRYLVTVRGNVTEPVRQAALAGFIDCGERLQCAAMMIQKASGRESHLEVTLTEGKNREIRRLFTALGHEVTRLRRIQYGPFLLGDLPPGFIRELPIEEARRMLINEAPR
jgi:23S rRNA pseudouridine2605 synthase